MLFIIHNERPDYTQNNLIRQPYYLGFSQKHNPAQKKTPRLMDVLFCAETQNRTADTAIFSRMLYQLSYLGQHPY